MHKRPLSFEQITNAICKACERRNMTSQDDSQNVKKVIFLDNKHWSELNACGLNYRGWRPFSEPETRAVASFLRRHQRSIIAYISYHSFGQMWMLPYGYSSDVTSKHELLMVRCMRHNAGNFERQ